MTVVCVQKSAALVQSMFCGTSQSSESEKEGEQSNSEPPTKQPRKESNSNKEQVATSTSKEQDASSSPHSKNVGNQGRDICKVEVQEVRRTHQKKKAKEVPVM